MGCSPGVRSTSHHEKTAQIESSALISPTEKMEPVQAVSDSVLAEAAMEQLITNIKRGSNLDEIHGWALKLLDQAPPTDEGRYELIEDIPEFLANLVPRRGP